MTRWTIKSSDICNSSGVTVVTSVTINTIVLVDLLSPWVVAAHVTSVLLALVDFIVGFRWAVVTSRALNSGTLTVFAKVARLACDTVSCLSGLSHHGLSLKRTGNSNGSTLGAVEASLTFVTSGVGLRMELRFPTEVTGQALASNNASTAVAASNTLLAIFVTSVHESTSWADRLTLF